MISNDQRFCMRSHGMETINPTLDGVVRASCWTNQRGFCQGKRVGVGILIPDSNRCGCRSHVGAALSKGVQNEGGKGETSTADGIEDCGPKWTAKMGVVLRVNPGALDHENIPM
ncbi:hypothetical protein GQ457_02G003550 [Hibiscus cannabinus]